MNRSPIVFTLLSLWIFAILGPTVITLSQPKDHLVVVWNNLNEEEHQKQGKKDLGEKEIINSRFIGGSLVAMLPDNGKPETHALVFSSLPQEIVLPPPKF